MVLAIGIRTWIGIGNEDFDALVYFFGFWEVVPTCKDGFDSMVIRDLQRDVVKSDN